MISMMNIACCTRITATTTSLLLVFMLWVEYNAQNTFADRCELSACKQLFFSVRRPENSRCSVSRCDNCCTSEDSSLFTCSSSSILCIADDNLELVLIPHWNNKRHRKISVWTWSDVRIFHVQHVPLQAGTRKSLTLPPWQYPVWDCGFHISLMQWTHQEWTTIPWKALMYQHNLWCPWKRPVKKPQKKGPRWTQSIMQRICFHHKLSHQYQH